MASDSKKQDKKSQKGPTPEEVINGFNQLRLDQRNIATKVAELELEENEHKMVIETLKQVNEDRTCYRMVGGVLMQKKVKDILPVLQLNQTKLAELIEKVNEQFWKKGMELVEYKEKHNIKVGGQDDFKDDQKETKPSESRGNVLVS
ncbi:prefoldin subunit 2 [Agrilus planipennis]|uniref:Prefoldin subunit 2 n=1 Tax=Agrilus planipennis TaxID=224129 RepID=A0A1W4X4Q5_AGRPL|nr:prefoldin subunit 2 [Agrilus planipennis]